MDLTGWVIVIGAGVAISTLTTHGIHAWSKWQLKRAVRAAADRPIDPAERDRRFGSLTIQGSTLYYTHRGAAVWSVTLDDCCMVAERTTALGPWATDWFIVFFGGTPLESHEAPIYANIHVHQMVSAALGVEVRPQLTNSTELRTAIAWPHELEGQPFLRYVSAPRGTGIIPRLKDRIAPLVQGQLTKEAHELLFPSDEPPNSRLQTVGAARRR